MIPVSVIFNDKDVFFKTGDDKVVYKSDINSFLENNGVTISNLVFPVESSKVYYLDLSALGDTFSCGNLFSNILLELDRTEEKNRILIIDFQDVNEVSESFLKTYTKFLLESKDKILTINMNTAISNEFASFVLSNVIGVEE